MKSFAKNIRRDARRGEVDADFTAELITSDAPVNLSFQEIKRYSSPNFELEFKQSIEKWCTASKVTIAIIRTHMIPEGGDKDTPTDLNHGAAIGMLRQVLKAWPMQSAGFRRSGPCCRSLKPLWEKNLPNPGNGIGLTFAQLTKAWADLIDEVSDKDYTTDFMKFVDEYKANPRNVTTDLTQWEHDFQIACANYKTTHMPSKQATSDAFIAELIKALADHKGSGDTVCQSGADMEVDWPARRLYRR